MHPAINPLHRARVQQKLSLSQVTARTLLSPRIVVLLDEGRFRELPGGVYARSHVRAFAAAVDLDADSVVAELEEHLPIAEDPFPAMLALRRISDPPLLVAWEDAVSSVKRAVAAQVTRITSACASLTGSTLGLDRINARLSHAWRQGVVVRVPKLRLAGRLGGGWLSQFPTLGLRTHMREP